MKTIKETKKDKERAIWFIVAGVLVKGYLQCEANEKIKTDVVDLAIAEIKKIGSF